MDRANCAREKEKEEGESHRRNACELMCVFISRQRRKIVCEEKLLENVIEMWVEDLNCIEIHLEIICIIS